jgi:hypothetical protein
MASKVRIITINEGEECLIRVNSRLPVTLEFPGHLVSVYEHKGVIFQRVEKQGEGSQAQTQEVEEVEADPYAETQNMDYGDTQIETQPNETPLWETPPSLKRALRDAAKYMDK